MATRRRTATTTADKTLTKREQERAERVTKLRDELDQAVLGLDDESNWVEYLNFVQRFGVQYSFGNQMLLLTQALMRGFEPTLVQSYGKWFAQADHRPGCAREKKSCTCPDLNVPARPAGMNPQEPFGLPVWAPFRRRLSPTECDEREARTGQKIERSAKNWSTQKFLVGWGIEWVFDRSQLRYPELVPVPEPLEVRRRVRVGSGPRAQLLVGQDTTGALADVIALIQAEGFSYRRGTCPGMTNGVTYFTQREVLVRDDVDDAQAVKTTVHELAHILCQHSELDGFDYVAHRGRAETEAESVAYIVCGALGLDTEAYSAPYVAHWSEGKAEVIRAAAEIVTKVAGRILTALDPVESEEAVQEAVLA